MANKIIHDLCRIAVFSIPVIIAILISELVTIQVYLVPSFGTDNMLALWRILELIPAFIFAYISDKQYRKGALVISHLLGLVSGVAAYLLGYPLWALVLIGLTFNPISVARAALLDNFPQYSSVKLVAITYCAMYIPWIFYDQISTIPLNSIIVFTLIMLFINTVITIVLFEDRKDLTHVNHSLQRAFFNKNVKKMSLMILAFILSQITIEWVWYLIHHYQNANAWLSLTNYGFVIGFACAVLYKKLPHMSIITLAYTTGFGISLIAIIGRAYGLFGCREAVFSSMSYYTVIAGVYLPFVTDGVISLFNPSRKAMASAIVELASRIAVILSYVFILYVAQDYCDSSYFIALLFLAAAFLQRRVEKLPSF